jgi:MEMO1 family protein
LYVVCVQTVRPPAVAGRFYPGSASELADTVDGLLAAATPRDRFPKALIVPHAGYVYSGPIAATAFAQIAQRASQITRVILIGPAHRELVEGLATPGADRLATPLGEIEVDSAALANVADITANPRAHSREHCLEVMLPFLQRIVPHAKVVPLIASRLSPERVGRALEALWGGPETLILISSDLSHFLSYADGRAKDRNTISRILALETTLDGDEACGAVAINGLSWIAKHAGLSPELLDLRSSGDTAGSRDEVVGYGAIALYEAA